MDQYTPLGTSLLARPKPLLWYAQGPLWCAHSALGDFSVTPLDGTDQPLWRPALNGAAFPIIAPTQEDAKNLVLLGHLAHGDPLPGALAWHTQADASLAHSTDAHQHPTLWSVQPSEGTAGFFVLRNNAPTFVALGDVEQAKGACMQYAAYVWAALSDLTLPPA